MKRTGFMKAAALVCMLALLFTTLSFGAVFAADNPTIALGTATAEPGETATIPLSVENADELAGFEVTITYDPTKITLVQPDGITPVGGMEDSVNGESALYVYNFVQEGEIRLAVASNAALSTTTDATDLFEFEFEVADTVPRGEEIPLEIQVEDTQSVTGTPLSPQSSNGSITTQRYTYSSHEVVSNFEVVYGTPATTVESRLPDQIAVYTVEGMTLTVSVDWDLSTYNPNSASAQRITGTLDLPDYITVPAGVQTDVIVTVTVQPEEEEPVNPGGGIIIGPGGGPGQDYDEHFAYIYGYEDRSVRPNNNITRAEVAAVFHRVMLQSGLLDPAIDLSVPTFSDVDPSHWAYQDIEVLVWRGVLDGYEDGTFRPSDPITRAEYAKVLATYNELNTTGIISAFSDTSGHWAESYIGAASRAGYVVGYEDGTFRPQNNLTRAEIATGTNRMLGRNVNTSSIDQVCVNPYNDIDASHWAYYEIMEASVDHNYTVVNGQENWYKLI